MLTEPQRTMVWEEWLAAEIRANYFADLSGAYHRRQRVATFTTLVFSSGAFAALLARLSWVPEWVPAALALLAAAVSLYSLVAQNLKAAVDCSDLHFRWNKLAMEYQDLWNAGDVEDADRRLGQLNERRAEASKSGTAFPYSKRRMLRWYELVVEHRAPKAA